MDNTLIFCSSSEYSKKDKLIPTLRFSHRLTHIFSDSETPSGQYTSQRCNHGSFEVTRHVDSYSPRIFAVCCECRRIDSVSFHFTEKFGNKGDEERIVLSYDLKKVAISGYEVEGTSNSGELPTETFSVDYSSIKMTFFEFAKEKKIDEFWASWDKIALKSEVSNNLGIS